jgi:hypothetical protein
MAMSVEGAEVEPADIVKFSAIGDLSKPKLITTKYKYSTLTHFIMPANSMFRGI